ncbi:MAG TPA: hypothetical protein VK625_23070, partial [Flavitalea sp.]|nr:hypothetical protein [Flavitalea sp.]
FRRLAACNHRESQPPDHGQYKLWRAVSGNHINESFFHGRESYKDVHKLVGDLGIISEVFNLDLLDHVGTTSIL